MEPSCVQLADAMNDASREARVERLHDWFAVQLDFADTLMERSAMSLDAAVTLHTNLHRRFGFGRTESGVSPPEWSDFVRRLAVLPTRTERIECTKAFARERLMSWSGAAERQFGCFSFEPPNDGVVRIHFSPNDGGDGVGPLSRTKYSRRIAELTDMFAFIRQQHGTGAQYVRGGSWLYNLEAYRRLFPPEYVASLQIHTAPSNFAGGSWWGQFVDHRENVVADRVAAFRANLRDLNRAEVWRVFPLPAMTARADVDAFYRHYGT